MYRKVILANANVLYMVVVTKSYKNVEEKGVGYVLPSGVYFVIDKKVTYIFSKRPKMAFRGKILKI